MDANTIERCAVLGAGTMGNGIAQVAAMCGIETRLFDVDAAAVERGTANVRANLDKGVEKGKVTAELRDASLAALSAGDLAAVAACDLIVEAVPEKLDLKQRIFAEVERSAPAHAIFATNTSSLSVTEIAADTGRAERVVGLHFFNPVPVMELLEIVRGLSTDDATIEAAVAFAKRIGKDPVVVKDWPGFATSRLGIILGCEAIRMVEQGVASPADIDKAMKLGYRHPMGPLELTDLVGLDVRLAIMEHLFAELGEQFRPPALLRQMVRAGKLGRKSGEGFYTY
ncbi:MAG: 3-hydroxybutyryl-CoA dehydrogenase [Myxococcales bacterium]|nr:3-hydroxybutyryl-CoA dehydrogenase [Myxococcales bacterium]